MPATLRGRHCSTRARRSSAPRKFVQPFDNEAGEHRKSDQWIEHSGDRHDRHDGERGAPVAGGMPNEPFGRRFHHMTGGEIVSKTIAMQPASMM
jgi:hypothetical protein